jgi:hypothetical protein
VSEQEWRWTVLIALSLIVWGFGYELLRIVRRLEEISGTLKEIPERLEEISDTLKEMLGESRRD